MAERQMHLAEEATGLRLSTCPWWSLRDPFVQAVVRAHRHWKVGELSARWPNPPAALLDGIEIFDGALNAVISHDLQKASEKADRPPQGPPGAPTAPLVRPRRRPPTRKP